MDRLTVTLEDSPQNGCTEVTQCSSFAASEHRGHEAAIACERDVPDGVHALMHTMESPPFYPPINLRPAQTKRRELSARYHPMLPPRNLRDRAVRRVRGHFFVHTTNK
jgi:hypothetical protein